MTISEWLIVVGLFIGAMGLCAWLVSWGLSHAMRAAGPGNAGLRLTIACWLPTALSVLVAVASGETTVALTMIYSSSVAAVTGVLGWALLFYPHSAAAEPQGRAPAVLFSLGLPVALLAWLIGFSGNLTPTHALALLIAAAVVLDAWAHQPGEPSPAAATPPARQRAWLIVTETVVCLSLGLGLGLMIVVAIRHTASLPIRLYPELVTVVPLAPLLLLPLFSKTAAHAASGRTTSAITMAMGTATLNLGLLLPLAAIAHAITQAVTSAAAAGAGTSTASAATLPATLPEAVSVSLPELANMSLAGIPLILWRLDNLLLVLVGLMMVGARLGIYRPGRRMGLALLLAYVGYVMTSSVMRLS